MEWKEHNKNIWIAEQPHQSRTPSKIIWCIEQDGARFKLMKSFFVDAESVPLTFGYRSSQSFQEAAQFAEELSKRKW